MTSFAEKYLQNEKDSRQQAADSRQQAADVEVLMCSGVARARVQCGSDK